MAELVFLNIPAHGHVNPTLPVVQALVADGHHVRYYNTQEFRDKIEKTGATFRPYPEPVLTSAEISALLRGGNMAQYTLTLLKMSETVLPFVLEELERDRPAVLIHDSTALWGSMSARLLDLPSVSSITHFIYDGTVIRPSLREMGFLISRAMGLFPRMLRIRQRLVKQYGKSIFQEDHMLPLKGDLNLLFTSERLQPRSAEIDSSFRFVGPSINPTTREAEDFPFDQLTRRPVIYISMGTVHTAQMAFYRQMFETFVGHPGQFVLAVGRDTDIARLGPAPANFIVRNFVPQLDVLPHVDAFVTHGGMNSVHEGLYFGVPLVMIPQQMEQLLNARVVAASGAGMIVGGKPPFGRATSGEVRAAVEQVLVDERMRKQARHIGEALRATGGYQQAADEIAQFAQHAANSNTYLTQAG